MAEEYRKRTRPKIRTEERACAWEKCRATFIWSSKLSRQVCCSKSCYGKYRWRKDNPEPVHAQEGYILCTKCGQQRPTSDYSPSRQHLKRSQCRDCMREYQNKWRKENTHRLSAASRRSKRKRTLRKYGAPTDDYDELLIQQDGVCAICKQEFDGQLTIDHDHAAEESKSYRGLLCPQCNKGLGCFSDDVECLRTAAAYLEGRVPNVLLQVRDAGKIHLS